MYSLDLNKFIPRHIRYKLRSADLVDWLIANTTPLNITISDINQFRSDKLRELDYNGRTIQLERLLNDNFDNTLRRIYILHDQIFNEVDFFVAELQNGDFDFYISEVAPAGTNGAGTAGTSGFLAEEGHLFYIGENPNAIIGGTNGTSGNIDFEIVSPVSLISKDAEIKGYVDKYKLASKRYRTTYV